MNYNRYLDLNKLRVTCHGAGSAKGGFSMGGAKMSPAEFVDPLVRHGLKRPDTHAAAVLVHGFRWKHDSEKAACEGCGKEFTFVRRKHHCRRCGGLFCDACSSKKLNLAVALTGENNATAEHVKKARVCDTCYNPVAGLTKALTGRCLTPRPATVPIVDPIPRLKAVTPGNLASTPTYSRRIDHRRQRHAPRAAHHIKHVGESAPLRRREYDCRVKSW